MAAHTPRTFEVPAALVASGFEATVDLDVLDREVEFPGEFGEWAEQVLFKENTKTLSDVCGDMRLLPRGVLAPVQLDDGSVLVAGLVNSDGRVWDAQFNAWGTPTDDVDVVGGTIILNDDEVAFVARALREGADEVWFRPYIPKAFVSAVVAAPAPPLDRTGKKAKTPEAPPTPQEVPAGSPVIAVVDPIDEDAVLEMLAITPGPHVLRRHDGEWFEDPAWVSVLKSVRPPKIVKLTEPQVASVSAQVDRSTADQDWEPFDADSREQYQIFTASAYIQGLQRESDEKALSALVAVAGREITPKDALATERLKKYWTVGRGAAKIRWGTPGSWRRCYRHLVKYLGPTVAPGYCTNLGQRLGGYGVADHVGTTAKRKLHIPGSPLKVASLEVTDEGEYAEPVTAANPSGENGYDNGMSFNESGVKRDYHGHFSSEGGGGSQDGRFLGREYSNGGDRLSRRRASIARSRKARAEKEAKTKTPAERKAEKAKREAQAAQLANLSLAIANASAAGDTIKAAQLRVQRAELRVQFADTPTEKANAQAALVNARASLVRAQRTAQRKKKKANPYNPNYRAWKDPGRSSTDRSLDMPDESP